MFSELKTFRLNPLCYIMFIIVVAPAIMEDQKIIILDEPFNGIEEETVKKIRELLIKEKKRGKIIIISTHIKEDLDILADKIFILRTN